MTGGLFIYIEVVAFFNPFPYRRIRGCTNLYGAEFDVRAVFVYNRKISVSLVNTAFKRATADSSITFSQ